MNFNFRPRKFFRFLLYPFSLLYGFAVIVRNYLFDKNIIKSVSFDLPVICVGNLSAGGTGKSPMVEYLLNLLKAAYKVATLSRGYKRKTKGFLLSSKTTTAHEIGDEPMQFHTKFPDVAVAVGEERILAIPQILQQKPETEVIILDDAFQHRSVKAGLNILLTDYSNLFTRDFFLPTGNLRDAKSSYKRADIIVVTKCPANLILARMNKIRKEINLLPHQNLFFTTLQYGELYHISTKEKKQIDSRDEVLLVSGIANPKPLESYLALQSKKCNSYLFSDHHNFNQQDIMEIKRRFTTIQSERKIIITTEKDAVKLIDFKKYFADIPLFVLPVQHTFLFGEGMHFDNLIGIFIESFSRDKI